MEKQFLFFLVIIIQNLYPVDSVFNNRNWEFEKTYDNINLYAIDKQYPCFYKAEVIVDKKYYDAVTKALLDFKNYPDIFPGTIMFKVLEAKPGSFLIYSVINFFPLKNRDYFIEGKYFESIDINNNKIWTLIWYPVYDETLISENLNSKNKHVKNINGRWIVRSINADKIKISVEYYNDWEVDANNEIKISIEKNATVTALKNFIKYCLRS